MGKFADSVKPEDREVVLLKKREDLYQALGDAWLAVYHISQLEDEGSAEHDWALKVSREINYFQCDLIDMRKGKFL